MGFWNDRICKPFAIPPPVERSLIDEWHTKGNLDERPAVLSSSNRFPGFLRNNQRTSLQRPLQNRARCRRKGRKNSLGLVQKVLVNEAGGSAYHDGRNFRAEFWLSGKVDSNILSPPLS